MTIYDKKVLPNNTKVRITNTGKHYSTHTYIHREMVRFNPIKGNIYTVIESFYCKVNERYLYVLEAFGGAVAVMGADGFEVVSTTILDDSLFED